MDDEQLVAGEDESDEFEEVARCIGPDEEHFRWSESGSRSATTMTWS